MKFKVGDKVKKSGWDETGIIEKIDHVGFWVYWPKKYYQWPYLERELKKVEIINHPNTNIFK